jgi:hypothetical protein
MHNHMNTCTNNPTKTPATARRTWRGALSVGVVALVGVLGACSGSNGEAAEEIGNGLGETAALDMRAANAAVPLLDAESEVTHTHTELVIMVDGEQVEVPANIGIDERIGKIAALHTHRTDGILHVESPEVEDVYTLDQFFQLYGVGSMKKDICTKYSATKMCNFEIVSEMDGPTDMSQILKDGDSILLKITTIA